MSLGEHFTCYLKEREGKDVLSTDDGFVVYRVRDEICEICEMYVIPEKRKTGVGSALCDRVAGFAAEIGCENLVCSVVPSTNGSTQSMKAILAYGFTLWQASPDRVWFCKKIGGK